MNIEKRYKEIWRDIPNYEGIYEVSNKCRVRTVKRFKMKGKKNKVRRILGGTIHKLNKFHQVNLIKDGVNKTYLIIDLYKMVYNGD